MTGPSLISLTKTTSFNNLVSGPCLQRDIGKVMAEHLIRKVIEIPVPLFCGVSNGLRQSPLRLINTENTSSPQELSVKVGVIWTRELV